MSNVPPITPPAEVDEFPGVLASVQQQFASYAAGPLFHTAATELWRTFHEHIPESLRQHYLCHECRRFIERYGNLVAISDSGQLTSALWTDSAPAGFDRAFGLMAEAVTQAAVTGVLIPERKLLGTPASRPAADGKVWTHFSVELPHAHSQLVRTAAQVEAQRKEDWNMLSRGLEEFPLGTIERAHSLLTSGTLYRSEKCIGAAEWLLALSRQLANLKSPQRRDAVLWRAVATAPAGFAHVRSSMIGTLLEDLQSGMAVAAIKRRFDEKMAPSQYMRAQVAPSAGNIAQAEKVISVLKAAGSLERRYATLSDLSQLLWQPKEQKAASQGGVFAHLTPKAKPQSEPMALPQRTMTWEKFARTVLPDAIRIEAQVPSKPDRMMALVTASKLDAPPILQWDTLAQRNPVSWYYHSGIDAEIKRRVEGAGGQYQGVDIRASLLWDNRNDLDLHVITPRGEHIYYAHKRSVCGGWLDVDMNVRGETTTPVENIRWSRGTAERGHYQVFVQNYRFHEPAQLPTAFKIEVEVSDEVYPFMAVVSPNRETGAASNVMIFAFDYEPGQKLRQPPRNTAVPTGGRPWNLAAGSWAAVTGIVPSPNQWGDRPLPQHGRHIFFLLKGCRDTTNGLGRGFFTETLQSEFHPIRATLEAYNRTAPIAGADEADACGLGMVADQPWNLSLRVTTESTVTTYLIDRWD
ncbi:MAG: hypothetical protein JNM83_13610 [Myxococcales bacterium]|jgi:hypothetical protein|nr:hypothetical protein [Myxococcales bacterium]